MVFFTFMNYAFVSRERQLHEYLITCLRKSTSGLELLVFSLSLTFSWKYSLIKSIVYGQTVHAFRTFTYVCCEKSMLGYSALFLNLSSSGNIFFRLMPNGDCLLRSISLLWIEDNSLKLMAGVKILLNATYYVQYPAFKSFYEKSQYVIDYFPPIAQSLN